MIRIMAVSGVLLVLFLLTSCGKEKNIIDMNNSFGSSNLSQDVKTDGRKSSGAENSKTSDLGAGVIAKSGNAVSSDDKEEVIRQLDKELDSLFDSINESKDYGESELGKN